VIRSKRFIPRERADDGCGSFASRLRGAQRVYDLGRRFAAHLCRLALLALFPAPSRRRLEVTRTPLWGERSRSRGPGRALSAIVCLADALWSDNIRIDHTGRRPRSLSFSPSTRLPIVTRPLSRSSSPSSPPQRPPQGRHSLSPWCPSHPTSSVIPPPRHERASTLAFASSSSPLPSRRAPVSPVQIVRQRCDCAGR
jgi:hypothetical protein